MLERFFITFIISLVSVSLILALGGCGKSGDQKTEAQGTTETTGEMAANHGMSSDGLAYVQTAEALYSCEMHPVLVSDNAEAQCPRCNMALTKMSDETVTELRDANPKGCSMCSIVVTGDSPMDQCPKCGMDMVAVPEAAAATDEADPHAGHNH